MPQTNPKLTPVTRINKFFSEEDYNLEISMGREYVEGDGNFTLILYKVDRTSTQFDSLYGEATKDGIKFFPPTELKVFPILEQPINEAYNKTQGTARYQQTGNLTFYIYQAQLTENRIDIDYGDYIGYPISENDIKYFSVTDDDKKNFNNGQSIMGYKGAIRTIICAPTDKSEFKGV